VLIRFDPFREVDRLMNQFPSPPPPTTRSFPMDATRRADRVVVQLDLPGVDPGSVDLTAEQGTLTIRAERQPDRQQGDELLVAERPHGTFTRQLLLSETLDTDRLTASYEQGVLRIEIPVAERAKPRRIEITRAEGGATAIEGTASEVGRPGGSTGGSGGSQGAQQGA
jgi:HSP20 family protein